MEYNQPVLLDNDNGFRQPWLDSIRKLSMCFCLPKGGGHERIKSGEYRRDGQPLSRYSSMQQRHPQEERRRLPRWSSLRLNSRDDPSTASSSSTTYEGDEDDSSSCISESFSLSSGSESSVPSSIPETAIPNRRPPLPEGGRDTKRPPRCASRAIATPPAIRRSSNSTVHTTSSQSSGHRRNSNLFEFSPEVRQQICHTPLPHEITTQAMGCGSFDDLSVASFSSAGGGAWDSFQDSCNDDHPEHPKHAALLQEQHSLELKQYEQSISSNATFPKSSSFLSLSEDGTVFEWLSTTTPPRSNTTAARDKMVQRTSSPVPSDSYCWEEPDQSSPQQPQDLVYLPKCPQLDAHFENEQSNVVFSGWTAYGSLGLRDRLLSGFGLERSNLRYLVLGISGCGSPFCRILEQGVEGQEDWQDVPLESVSSCEISSHYGRCVILNDSILLLPVSLPSCLFQAKDNRYLVSSCCFEQVSHTMVAPFQETSFYDVDMEFSFAPHQQSDAAMHILFSFDAFLRRV